MQWFARLLFAFMPQTAFTLVYSRCITKSRLILPQLRIQWVGKRGKPLALELLSVYWERWVSIQVHRYKMLLCFFFSYYMHALFQFRDV